jgi:hypothetical protein
MKPDDLLGTITGTRFPELDLGRAKPDPAHKEILCRSDSDHARLGGVQG